MLQKSNSSSGSPDGDVFPDERIWNKGFSKKDGRQRKDENYKKNSEDETRKKKEIQIERKKSSEILS